MLGKLDRIRAAVVEPPSLDQAQRCVEHRGEAIECGRRRDDAPAFPPTPLQALDIDLKIAPVLLPWRGLRANETAAHVRVECVEFHAEATSSFVGINQHVGLSH